MNARSCAHVKPHTCTWSVISSSHLLFNTVSSHQLHNQHFTSFHHLLSLLLLLFFLIVSIFHLNKNLPKWLIGKLLHCLMPLLYSTVVKKKKREKKKPKISILCFGWFVASDLVLCLQFPFVQYFHLSFFFLIFFILGFLVHIPSPFQYLLLLYSFYFTFLIFYSLALLVCPLPFLSCL